MIPRAMVWLALLGVGVAMSLLLGGCGDPFATPVNREYTRTETHVFWQEVASDAELRAACARTAEDRQILACAVLSGDRSTCTVFTHRNPPLETLGHEFLHCFAGRWHG